MIRSYWRDNPLVSPDFLTTLPQFSQLSPDARVMLIVPHPDDETLGCAGLVQQVTRLKIPFKLIMATDGNRRGKKVRRRAEVLAAMGRCGVTEKDFIFFDYPDGKLSAQEDLPDRLLQELQTFKPNLVIVTDPEDTHHDHAVLGNVVLALRPQVPSLAMILGILIHYHRFPRPIGKKISAPLLPPGRLVTEATPWFTLPLSPEEQLIKRAALAEFKSQLLTPFLRGLMLSFDRPNELYRQLYA